MSNPQDTTNKDAFLPFLSTKLLIIGVNIPAVTYGIVNNPPAAVDVKLNLSYKYLFAIFRNEKNDKKHKIPLI